MVDCHNNGPNKWCLPYPGVGIVSSQVDYRVGYMTCFGPWNLSKQDVSRDVKVTCTLELLSLNAAWSQKKARAKLLETHGPHRRSTSTIRHVHNVTCNHPAPKGLPEDCTHMSDPRREQQEDHPVQCSQSCQCTRKTNTSKAELVC